MRGIDINFERRVKKATQSKLGLDDKLTAIYEYEPSSIRHLDEARLHGRRITAAPRRGPLNRPPIMLSPTLNRPKEARPLKFDKQTATGIRG